MKVNLMSRWQNLLDEVKSTSPVKMYGQIDQVTGLVMVSNGPKAAVGEICQVSTGNGQVLAEVVGFRDKKILLMPIGEMDGIVPGAEVSATGQPLTVRVSEKLLGRVLDGLGNPMDGLGEIADFDLYPIVNKPPHPLKRQRIQHPLPLGIKAIDGLLTCGKGQRLGIFAGSGVGKSTLMGMIARNTAASVNVIGLIGERGREVREFIERDLQEECLKRSVVVVSTSDQPALARIKAAFVATTIAEYFRDMGHDVLLMMDSVTRFAMAQREVGLATGEPPTTRGYTPSVFALLPKLLERAGAGERGSITGLYTVLVEGDDLNEPVSDTVRGVLDGHIALSRELAEKGHYPAIDVLASVSRSMPDITDKTHRNNAKHLRRVLASYRGAEDLINIGAYEPGSNADIDYALEKIEAVNQFLRQEVEEKLDFDTTLTNLQAIFAE